MGRGKRDIGKVVKRKDWKGKVGKEGKLRKVGR